jgi:hypothetical protein
MKFIEKVSLSSWIFPKSKLKWQAVLGFKTLNEYVTCICWPRMEHRWKALLSISGTNSPGLLYPLHDKSKRAAAPKGRKTRTEKESFVAPMKSTLAFKDGVLQMVTKSSSQMIVETNKKVASVFPPLVAVNPTKTMVKKVLLQVDNVNMGSLNS